ncbi:hypothetical protein [Bacillus sp. AR18-7]|uniref:hypothetical protein n=1 Tax=Bacillus sp. AR18-7 TaxID=2217821 RepID=UPI0011CB8059|nr:hypothetical protein [Bacillus sp. AR18-7]TXR68243.1 hypothetical protein DN395_00410 [Bacillus sp. AR18-7]
MKEIEDKKINDSKTLLKRIQDIKKPDSQEDTITKIKMYFNDRRGTGTDVEGFPFWDSIYPGENTYYLLMANAETFIRYFFMNSHEGFHIYDIVLLSESRSVEMMMDVGMGYSLREMGSFGAIYWSR